jgi:hypothetical protein
MPALKYWDIATSTWKTGAVGLPSGQVWSTVIGDGVNTSFLVTHGFGTRAVYVSVYRNSPPYDEVEVDVERTDTSSVTIRTAPTVPAVSEYIVVVASAGTQATLNITMDTWHTVGAAGEPAFGSGYSNVAGNQVAQFRKDSLGRVLLRGYINTVAAGGLAFTLPAGYRPPGTVRFVANSQNAGGTQVPALIYVLSDGTINVHSTNAPTAADLSVIEFDTDSVLQTASVAAQPLDNVHFVGGSGEPIMGQNWLNYDNSAQVPGTGSQRSVGFRKYPDGRVRLFGTIKGGNANSVVFTLPAGYRPRADAPAFAVTASVANIYVQIAASGTVTIMGAGTAPSYVFLDGIEFDTETVAAYASGFLGPPKVTVLPANPVDGQECYFVADAANGVVWHLRYNATASITSYKTGTGTWEVVGGSQLIGESVVNMGVIVGTTYQVIGSGLCAVTCPLMGDYDVTPYAGSAGTETPTSTLGIISYKIGAAGPVDADGATIRGEVSGSNNFTSISMTRRKSITAAATVLQVWARTDQSAGRFWVNANGPWPIGIRAMPVRVG